ncbi:MAG: hypothetical protein HY707_03950 [Ignavibacteriae bacterium]|nr:hypothetical protein [Ignavibacteriota bacterium]
MDKRKVTWTDRTILIVRMLAIALVLLGFFQWAGETFPQRKGNDLGEDLYRYIDHGKGFAYIPVKPFSKNSISVFLEAEGTLEIFEKWRDTYPNKVITVAFGDGLGKEGQNTGYFIIYDSKKQ